MMPPDTSSVQQEPIRSALKDSKTPSPCPSRVRNLLGLPNIVAVPLLSTMSLPMVDLPYINSQMGVANSAPQLWGGSQWAKSEFDALDNEDGGDLEPLLSDSNQDPPLSEFSGLLQKTFNDISGLRPTRPSNSLSSSLSSGSSLKEEENLTNSTTKSELKTTVSSEESLSTVLAENSTAENNYLANLSSEKAPETGLKVEDKGEPTEGTKLTPVDEDSENPGSVLRSIPQKTSIIIPELTPPSSSNSQSSSVSSDSSLEKEGNLSEPPTKSELKTTISSEESLSTFLAGSSTTAENHYLANPSSERVAETEIGVKPEGELTNNSTGRQTILNLSNSQPKVKSRPQAESISPVLTPQTDFIPESMTKKPMASLPLPLSETLPVGEVARSEYQKVNSSMITQIKKLERTVADLSAQVAAQKDFQQPVIPQYPQPNQPQVIVQRSTSQSKAPQAFWERSYMNRLYRWSRR